MQALSDDEWAHIRSVGRLRVYSTGSYLASEGGTDQSVFAIDSGAVSIVLAGEDGTQHLVGIRGRGAVVGEMAAIDGLTRSASIVAKGRVTSYVLTAEQFRQFLKEHPDASIRVMRSMARRIRQAATMYVLRAEPLTSRVAAMLVTLVVEGLGRVDGVDGNQLASSGPTGSSPSPSVELEITQQELADWVGASREATARVLGDMRSQELVETRRGRIVVLDWESLARL